MGKAGLQTQTSLSCKRESRTTSVDNKVYDIDQVQSVQNKEEFPVSFVVKVGRMIIFCSICTFIQIPEFRLNDCA